jgi:hypothetical protein
MQTYMPTAANAEKKHSTTIESGFRRDSEKAKRRTEPLKRIILTGRPMKS